MSDYISTAFENTTPFDGLVAFVLVVGLVVGVVVGMAFAMSLQP